MKENGLPERGFAKQSKEAVRWRLGGCGRRWGASGLLRLLVVRGGRREEGGGDGGDGAVVMVKKRDDGEGGGTQQLERE